MDLPGLAAAAAAAASKQQAASNSTREIGKNQISVVVLQIRVKFWCMIPMGVMYNHTKFEQETQRWRPGTEFASGRPQFQKLRFRAKNSHFLGQKSPGTHSKRPNEWTRLTPYLPEIVTVSGGRVQKGSAPSTQWKDVVAVPVQLAMVDGNGKCNRTDKCMLVVVLPDAIPLWNASVMKAVLFVHFSG